MSGPSATANPMSAKIAVSSSSTWLSGWIRPCSAGASRSGSVTSTVSDFSRASRAADFRMSRRAESAWVTASLARLIAAPCVLRSSGDILPSVDSSAEIEPFLPSAATRTASRAASSPAAAISPRMVCSSVARSDMATVTFWGVRSRPNTRSSSSAKADDPVTPGVNNFGRRLLDAPPSRGMTPELQEAASDFRTQAASAALAFSAMAWNAAGSVMARSDNTLRSTVMPDLDRPLIKTL